MESWPHERAVVAGKINPAGGVRNDRSVFWQSGFRKEVRHLAEFAVAAFEQVMN